MVKDWESGTFGVLGTADLAEIATAEVVPHMVAAYKEGRMKATASIGRRLVQKNLELSRKLRQIREAVMNQSHLHSLQNVLTDLLGEDEGPSTAEQEIRAKALNEAADIADAAGDAMREADGTWPEEWSSREVRDAVQAAAGKIRDRATLAKEGF
jgi:hypothetical protein